MSWIIDVRNQLRPCYVHVKPDVKKKALFHCWSFESEVIEPSLMIGEHPGGTMSCTMAIVELENGRIITMPPASIQFLDNKFNEYFLSERGE